MCEFVSVPDDWTVVEYDVGPQMGDEPYTERFDAEWIDQHGQLSIRASHSTDHRTGLVYPVLIEQTIRSGPYEADIVTHGRFCSNRKDAEESVQEFVDEVGSDEHRVVAFDHHEWERTVQFYTICDSVCPDGYSARDVIDAMNRADERDEMNRIDELDGSISLDGTETITIDVYPVADNEVRIENDETTET